jgi:hypothetical protein
MVIIDKTHQNPKYHCDRDGKPGRQRALDAMLEAAKATGVCPACAASGALYLAATAWINSLDRPFEEFMELAEKVFRSTERQRDERTN